MKHKLTGTRTHHKMRLPTFPPALYDDFRELLIEQLTLDDSFKCKHLLASFESKCIDLKQSASPQLRRSRAIEKWLATEEKNRATNMRLMFAEDGDVVSSSEDKTIHYGQLRDTIRRFIASTIGHTVNFDDLCGSFSGGASTSIKRGVGTIARKFQDGTNITSKAILPYMQLARMANLLPHELAIVPGNVLFTVEKNSDIDRVACKEPELNMFCQKAVGDFIRSRLRRVGINLNDQGRNQGLAYTGSVDGSLATLDLSSASDSVTTQIVTELLPIDWSLLLMDLRSPFTMVDGVQHENEMISSMGNGFTFELQSLLFWATIRAVTYLLGTTGSIGVFGDDLIVPTGAVAHLKNVLEYLGFSLNESKSFWDGSFRESCGSHWFAGQDVTPFYVKEVPKTVPDWCNLLNSLRRWAVSMPGICDPRYYDIWSLFSEKIPRPLVGSYDLNRSDALVSPTIRNVAVCRPRNRTDSSTERRYQYGAYACWLSTNEQRPLGSEISDAVDMFNREDELVIRRRKTLDPSFGMLDIPMFPQEHRAL